MCCVNPTDPAIAAANLRDVETAARAMGLDIRVLNASNRDEIDAAYATFAGERPDALFVSSDPFFSAGASRWLTWRRAMRSLPFTDRGYTPKSAG